ncbi:CrcB family protein [Microbacterium indicum]|uniref:CrcB family protein n=1 Tax=Microbacterium indicum TaxID=358100 RepID=UPI0004163B7C|nr:CrcB family protein [Microbacterium indicum]
MRSDAPRVDWIQLPLVVAGGAVGALLRYLIAPTSAQFAWLIGINVVGSIALGVVFGVLSDRHPRLRMLLGTGLLGGFTSYSSFAVVLAAHAVADPGAAWLVLVGAALVVAGSAACALAGLALGERAVRRA